MPCEPVKVGLSSCSLSGWFLPQTRQKPWPTKGWPVAEPRAVGLDPKVLDALDADIAAGKYGYVDSMLVIRHGKLAYERHYKHDYDQIYGESAGRRARSTPTTRPALTTISIRGGTRSTGAATCIRCSR